MSAGPHAALYSFMTSIPTAGDLLRVKYNVQGRVGACMGTRLGPIVMVVPSLDMKFQHCCWHFLLAIYL